MSEEAAYDAAAAQAAASAIAAKFAQQHAATEGDGPVEDLASGKRKYEEDPAVDALGDEHIRKRSSFTGPEGAYNGVRAGSVCFMVCIESLAVCPSQPVLYVVAQRHGGSVWVPILITSAHDWRLGHQSGRSAILPWLDMAEEAYVCFLGSSRPFVEPAHVQSCSFQSLDEVRLTSSCRALGSQTRLARTHSQRQQLPWRRAWSMALMVSASVSMSAS